MMLLGWIIATLGFLSMCGSFGALMIEDSSEVLVFWLFFGGSLALFLGVFLNSIGYYEQPDDEASVPGSDQS